MSGELAPARTNLRAPPNKRVVKFQVPRHTPVMHAAIVRGTPRVIYIELLGGDVVRHPHLRFREPVVILPDLERKLMGRRP